MSGTVIKANRGRFSTLQKMQSAQGIATCSFCYLISKAIHHCISLIHLPLGRIPVAFWSTCLLTFCPARALYMWMQTHTCASVCVNARGHPSMWILTFHLKAMFLLFSTEYARLARAWVSSSSASIPTYKHYGYTMLQLYMGLGIRTLVFMFPLQLLYLLP